MNRKHLLISCAICVFLLAQPALHAQIREYVGIVRSTLSPESIANLEKLRDSLKNEGYPTIPDIIDNCLEGGFGSGFLYVSSDGKNYVITNRHVVSHAFTASIEFDHKDGTTTKYDGLTVLAEDDDIDLAILSFPENSKPFKIGLTLDTTVRDDGEEIWSAGFPGLSNTPIWQLGKGTITNAHAKIPELANPEKTYLLQHSAQVDAGNSGGPLLTASKASPGGYRVIGINTWKAVNRQATNYSIPSVAIESFIARALSGKPANADAIQARTESFIGTITTEQPAYQKIAKYITTDYATAAGSDAFMEILLKAPSSVREYVLSEFAGYSPIEGLRYAVAYSIEKQLSAPDGTIALAIDAAAANSDGTYAYHFSSPEGKWNCLWKKEHGLFRIDSFLSQDQPDDAKSKRVQKNAKQATGKQTTAKASTDTPYSFLILGSYGLPLDGNTTSTVGGSLLYSFTDHIYTAFGAFKQMSDETVTDSFFGSTSKIELSTFMIQFGLRLQAPFVYETFSLYPYVQGSWGAGTASYDDESTFVSGTALEGGVLFGMGAHQSFFAECAISRKSIGSMDFFDRMKPISLMLSAGFGF